MNRISVAIIEGVIPSYRVPFLARLSTVDSLDVTCFHGEGKPGHSVASVGNDIPVKSAPIRNLHWPGGGARIAWQTGLRDILAGRYDAVVCAESVHNLSTWLVLLFRRLGGYAVILSGHGLGTIPRGGLFSRIRMGLRRFLARKADALLVYTEAGAADCALHGIDPRKVFISGNTLDTEQLIAVARGLDRAESDDGADPGQAMANDPVRLNLLYVGRLYPAKRVDVLIRATAILRDRGVRCRTTIVGDGHQKAELQAMAGPDDVRFAGACYDDYALARHFRNADILVVPDSVGLVVVHAFSNATPILSSRAGSGHGPEFDYIEDGRNGRLVDTLSPADFADALQALAEDRDGLARMAAEAEETARSLSMTAMVSQFAQAMEFSAGRERKAA